jgi:actin related protein 2/3 complex subunit 1A/1B
MATEKHQLFAATPITSHCFSQDKKMVAVVPNNNTVQIFEKENNTFKNVYTLQEHDHLVTCVDWAPKSNRIVTCSQDRNAYVWTWQPDSKIWKPTLVLLRINRAATHVRWSPNEDKFAVASSSKLVSVCYFEDENKFFTLT